MELLDTSPSEMLEVMKNHKVRLLNLDLLPMQFSRKAGNEKK